MRQAGSSSQSRKRSHASSTSKSVAAGRTKTTTPYSAEFEQKLIDRGVYPEGYEGSDGEPREPDNLQEIHQILAESRASLSPSKLTDDHFKKFKRDNRRATSESKAMAEVIPFITGSGDKQFETSGDLPFNRLLKFDSELSAPKPDKYYGARPEQINARVRRDLDEFIIPSNRTDLPAAPNFFLEGKSASGRFDVAERQAMYDGAVGARGILQLQNYGSTTSVPDGNAYTISAAYHAGPGFLQLYTTHPRESSTGTTEYYMTQLGAYSMTNTPDTFRSGAAAYRNARDWAKQRRDHFIASANAAVLETAAEQVSTGPTESNTDAPSTAVVTGSFSSETSADELALDCTNERKRQKPSDIQINESTA
jgi:hypothetical protein